MIADKILRSEISRFKILSANFKIQPQRLKFSRAPVIWLRPHFKFYRPPQNLARKTDVPQSRSRRDAKSRRKFYRFAVGQIPCCEARICAPRRIKSAPQSKFRASLAPQPGLQRYCAQARFVKSATQEL